MNPKSILFYSEGEGLGDGLLKIPMIRGLRQQFPEARITWLTGPDRTLLATVLYDWVKDDLHEILNHTGFGTSWEHAFYHPFHKKTYDLIIDGQSKTLPALSLWRIPHQRFVSTSIGGWLSHHRRQLKKPRPRHAIDRLKHLYTLATGQILDMAWQPHFTKSLKEEAERLLPPGPVYIGISPGAGGLDKCWPRENFVALAEEILAFGAVPVFLLGPMEANWKESLEIPGTRFPLQETTLTSLDLTVALGQRLSAAVCNDSGTSHLLAVSQIPLVVLFGPTSPDKLSPCAPVTQIIRAQDFGTQRIEAIPLGAVLQTLRPYLPKSFAKTALSL